MSTIYITDESTTDRLEYRDDNGQDNADEIIAATGAEPSKHDGIDWDMTREDFEWWDGIFAKLGKIEDWEEKYGITAEALAGYELPGYDDLEQHCYECQCVIDDVVTSIENARSADYAPCVAVHSTKGDLVWYSPDKLTVIRVNDEDDSVRLSWFSERDAKHRTAYIDSWDKSEAQYAFETAEKCECSYFEEACNS